MANNLWFKNKLASTGTSCILYDGALTPKGGNFNCRVLWPRILYFYSITLMQFMLPNSFGVQQEQEGSFIQLSSAKNRYSYLPGIREMVAFHIPFLSFFIRFA
jgi:hypothetical protein